MNANFFFDPRRVMRLPASLMFGVYIEGLKAEFARKKDNLREDENNRNVLKSGVEVIQVASFPVNIVISWGELSKDRM